MASTKRQAGPMTVGELSRRTGVPVKTLRQYTDWGLICAVGRSPANYRLFGTDALRCVRMIGQLRGLGLRVAEIRELTGSGITRQEELAGSRLAGLLRRSRERLTAGIAESQQMLRRIDEFEASHQAEIAGLGRTCQADDPRRARSS